MPFLRSSTRPQAVECFFCLSPALLAPETGLRSGSKGKDKLCQSGTKWNWHCKRCGCWNIRDGQGEIMSDLPAMHNSALNEKSFSLRATPSKSRLPVASSSTSPFCRSCLANQTLIMNMLANYLPDDDDPTFASLYAALPGYLSNLHSRYPPVCPNCQPAVDEVLRKSDQKARGEVLTRALRRGVQRSQEGLWRGPSIWAIWGWRISGLMYCAATAGSISKALIYTADTQILRMLNSRCAQIAILMASIFGLFWDPYWRRKTRYGDQATVRGMDTWRRNNVLILLSRLISLVPIYDDFQHVCLPLTSAFEISLLLHALLNLRISQPVSLRFVRPVPLSVPSTPVQPNDASRSEPIPLSSLSLDHDPLLHANPIFGQPSLHHQRLPTPPQDEAEPMDWEPAASASQTNSAWPTRPLDWSPDERDDVMFGTPQKSDWDRFAVQKQRMFPKQTGNEETGLESLLAGWGIGQVNDSGKGGITEHAADIGRAKQNGIILVIDTRNIVRFTFVLLGLLRLGLAMSVLASGEASTAMSKLDRHHAISTFELAVAIFALPSTYQCPLRLVHILGVSISRVTFMLIMTITNTQTIHPVSTLAQLWCMWGALDLLCAY